MYLYKITNICNQECYIGFTSTSVEKRFKEHLKNSRYKRCKQKIYNAIRKYGVENFIVEQIYEGEDALQRENEYIKKYKATYNMADGGNKPPSQKGNTWKLSEETKEKLRKPKPPRTLEHIEKIAAKHRGRKQSPEHIKKRVENTIFHRPIGNQNRAKKYVVTYPDGKEEIVFNIAKFAKKHDLFPSNICNVCKGKVKHTKGFKFRYYET